MYTINFTLKQHTPIIHFQHDQEGATLRATEVKPKLDKFLKAKYNLTTSTIINNRRKEVPKTEFKKWFPNKEFCSLDYKIKISTSETIWTSPVTIIPPNIDTAIIKDDFEITFISVHEDLLIKIQNSIQKFFIVNNFGKRQSKGFGCFYVDTTDINSFRNLNRPIFRYNNNDFVNDGLNFYQIVTKCWRNLKSGSNRPYKKSRLFKYMYDNNLRWDKRWFKVKLYDLINDPANTDNELKHDLLSYHDPLDVSEIENDNIDNNGYYSWDDNEDYDDYDYCFARALLGLAEHYEFRTVSNERIYQLKVKSDTISRFKSPVTFKIFENNLYAIFDSIPEFPDRNFIFDLIVKNPRTRDVIREKNDFTHLEIPENFSLNDFLSNHFASVGFNRL